MKYCDNVVFATFTLECCHLLGKPHYSIWNSGRLGFLSTLENNSNAVNDKNLQGMENAFFINYPFFIVLLLQFYGISLMSL